MYSHEEDRFIIDLMQWSFSRISSFDSDCKYAWHLKYIDKKSRPDSGFFAAFGTFCHEILEKYFKKELSLKELVDYYKDNFWIVLNMKAPYNLYTDIKQSYYEKGLEYFENFEFDHDRYEVLGIEKKVEFEIGGYPFIGYIDLLCRDEEDGKLVLIDHKSASIKVLKSGKISKADREHYLAFQRQQYLYSKAILEEFGAESIKELRWNMFKDMVWLSCEWNKDEYEAALKWAEDTIHQIEDEESWDMKDKVDFFCNNLCDVKYDCPLYLDSRNSKAEMSE